MNAVAVTHSARRQATAKPPYSRSRFAYLFDDLTDEKESRMCACLSIFHRGKIYQPVVLKRTFRAVGEQRNRAIYEIARMPNREPGYRWAVIGWDLDHPEFIFMTVPTKKFALAMLREFPKR